LYQQFGLGYETELAVIKEALIVIGGVGQAKQSKNSEWRWWVWSM